ncbi:hypothetical protein F5880DRAFT_1625331 [Lentinula raphanica]|nr:hypothetical protein F5880DRAFT_1625331 [Lentinula raphanica]
MSIAIAPWGTELEGGTTVEVFPPWDLKITNVALGDVLADANERTTFKLTIPVLSQDSFEDDEDEDDDEDEKNAGPKAQTITICSLTAGKIEQSMVSIILLEGQSYKFQIVGKNTVCLSGYYLDQNVPGMGGGMSDDESEDEDEDVHDLRYVSSDVEMPMDELDMDSDASRFEELEDEKDLPTGSKRGHDSLASNDAADAAPAKPSKAEKKKNKKQKLQDGTAAASGAPQEKKEEDTQKDGEKKADGQKGDKKAKEDKTKPKEKELPSGLKIKDAKVGTGPMAKKGQTISMRYIGKLTNGKIFDSNTKGKPFIFRLGAGEVIKGWDEGIAGMQAGGERVLTVPPALGYGKRGSPPEIPGNSTLIFEVKCVSIK